jgi:hypothetical protein
LKQEGINIAQPTFTKSFKAIIQSQVEALNAARYVLPTCKDKKLEWNFSSDAKREEINELVELDDTSTDIKAYFYV